MSCFSRLFGKKSVRPIKKPDASFIGKGIRKAKADHIRAVRSLVAEARRQEQDTAVAKALVSKAVEKAIR